MISLTEQQRAAVQDRNNLSLVACPGSGKTRVIIAKLLALAEDTVERPRSIGCITYTNAAVDEIESRLKVYGSRKAMQLTSVATIHSFCLENVLRPFSWLIEEVPSGFRVLSPQERDFNLIVEQTEGHFNRPVEFRTLDHYSSLRLDIQGNFAGTAIANGDITREAANLYWRLVLERGYLDFSMILYYTFLILRNFPWVATGIASKFQWLLIDEYQDTTDVQIEILRCMQSVNVSKFFLVGDHEQSIQGFAGARLDLSEQFADEIGGHRDFALSGNFRSSRPVVAFAERIISRDPVMLAVGPNQDIAVEPQYVHVDRAVNAITELFLPALSDQSIELGNSAVLAPWWQHLIPIARALRRRGVPVFGPGARPYKKSRVFALLAEQLCACAESNDLLGIEGVERALFRLVGQLSGKTRFDVFSYRGRMTALRLIYMARELAKTNGSGTSWLRSASRQAVEIIVQDEWVPRRFAETLVLSAEEILSDMHKNKVDLEQLHIRDLGLFADPKSALKLSTLHHAKGREYDAVALVHLNDGQIPHFSARSQDEIDEARRLFYVGATRAKKLLVLASDQSNPRNVPTRFLEECGAR
ncbi:MAG: ATP-dependent helicase [Pseudomonadota bacterium]